MEDEFFVEAQPLDELIYNAMDDAMPFSMAEIEAAFPTYDYWPLYRKLQKLEKDKRIVFYRYVGKKKYYRKQLVNNLPHITKADGSDFPISIFVTKPELFYDDERRMWKHLEHMHVNDVPLLFANLLVIANSGDLSDAEMKQKWLLIRQQLMEARQMMKIGMEWVDSVVEHISMSGDMERFKAIMGGKDAPSIEAIHAYIRFHNRAMKND